MENSAVWYGTCFGGARFFAAIDAPRAEEEIARHDASAPRSEGRNS